MTSEPWTLPPKQGLYDPTLEREACGVGFIVAIDGKRSHKVSRFEFFIQLLNIKFGKKENSKKKCNNNERYNRTIKLLDKYILYQITYINNVNFLKIKIKANSIFILSLRKRSLTLQLNYKI